MAAPLKVLIIGGGIAGPALAYWLSHISANITIIERSPQMRASGQQLDLRGNGVGLMKRMGIEAAIRAVVVRETGTQLIDTHGQTKAFFPAAQNGSGKQSITSEFEIMRGDFVRILYDLTKDHPNVRHIFNSTVESFTQDEESDPNGKVHVTFGDGSKEDFDLVVGADGTASKTRKAMLGPDAPDPRHPRGGYIGFFSIPSKPGDPNRFTFCHLSGGRVIATRKDCPELTRVYMMTNDEDPNLAAAHKSGNLADLKKAWGDLYKDGGWECDRFMQGLRDGPESDDLYGTRLENVRLPIGSWSKGRVVLIGDSAYGQTADGRGCTRSLEGAYILAGEIAALYEKDKSAPGVAVIQGAKNYEERYRPMSTESFGPKWIHSLLFPKSGFGISVLHNFARVAAYFMTSRNQKPVEISVEAIAAAKDSEWQLPLYSEILKSGVEA
ncbi:hypothetical protein ABW20_dc0104202 [Dactylellina cionopaga]|nr:hypothetical protein ABW20_dc0104202 [Dactylellina cionopaga]